MNLPAGWLSPKEANELQRLAKGKTVLELGAWKGRSTVALSQVARHVVSVDRHQGIEEAGGEDSLPDYLQSVRELPNITIVISDFQTFVPFLAVAFDLVFVDGDHDADSVERDIILGCKHVYFSNGIVVMHDFDFETVREGAARVFRDRQPDSLVGSLAAFTVQ